MQSYGVKMAVFRFVVGSGARSVQIEKEQTECPVVGKKIGDSFAGSFLGLEGYKLKITGATDKDGIPQNSDLEITGKKRILFSEGFGFNGKKKPPGRPKGKRTRREGLRKRRISRGNIISADTMQINCKVEEAGPTKFEEIFPAKEKAAEPAKVA